MMKGIMALAERGESLRRRPAGREARRGTFPQVWFCDLATSYLREV